MKKFNISKHFAQIAPVYRHVRTLDPEPILAIRDILVQHKKLKKPIKNCRHRGWNWKIHRAFD